MSEPIKKKRKGPASDRRERKKAPGKKRKLKSAGKRKAKEQAKPRVRRELRKRKPKERKGQRAYRGGEKVAGAEALTQILALLKKNMPKSNNYCVGRLQSDDLIITKVGGVTEDTAEMPALAEYIKSNGIVTGRKIYLAQKYNSAGSSNHAEMCIVAAAKVMNDDVVQIGCTGANCPYCAAYLSHAGISSLNEGEAGRSQVGWYHPTANFFWGTSIGNSSVDEQVEDLEAYLKEGTQPKIGTPTITPSEGRYTLWLPEDA